MLQKIVNIIDSYPVAKLCRQVRICFRSYISIFSIPYTLSNWNTTMPTNWEHCKVEDELQSIIYSGIESEVRILISTLNVRGPSYLGLTMSIS